MAKKRSKGLPFVVKPRLAPIMERIGNEDIGIWEIERRGYLTVAEKAFTQAASIDDDSMTMLQGLSARIASETGRSRLEVFEAITGQGEEVHDWMIPYQDEISKVVMSMMMFQEKLKFVQATALIFSRIDSDWSIDQTLELNQAHVDQLAELYVDEEAKDTTAIEASLEAAEAGAVEKRGK